MNSRYAKFYEAFSHQIFRTTKASKKKCFTHDPVEHKCTIRHILIWSGVFNIWAYPIGIFAWFDSMGLVFWDCEHKYFWIMDLDIWLTELKHLIDEWPKILSVCMATPREGQFRGQWASCVCQNKKWSYLIKRRQKYWQYFLHCRSYVGVGFSDFPKSKRWWIEDAVLSVMSHDKMLTAQRVIGVFLIPTSHGCASSVSCLCLVCVCHESRVLRDSWTWGTHPICRPMCLTWLRARVSYMTHACSVWNDSWLLASCIYTYGFLCRGRIWLTSRCVWSTHGSWRLVYTGWRRLIGSPKLQIIVHKRAIKYKSLLREMTYKIRDPMSLGHPVDSWLLVSRSYTTNVSVCLI